jgi:aspartate oxidase
MPVETEGDWVVGAAEAGPSDEAPLPNDADLARDKLRLRDLMWEWAGIVRSDERLLRAAEELAALKTAHEDRWRRTQWTADSAELAT